MTVSGWYVPHRVLLHYNRLQDGVALAKWSHCLGIALIRYRFISFRQSIKAYHRSVPLEGRFLAGHFNVFSCWLLVSNSCLAPFLKRIPLPFARTMSSVFKNWTLCEQKWRNYLDKVTYPSSTMDSSCVTHSLCALIDVLLSCIYSSSCKSIMVINVMYY